MDNEDYTKLPQISLDLRRRDLVAHSGDYC